jgi:hypothetical protein
VGVLNFDCQLKVKKGNVNVQRPQSLYHVPHWDPPLGP